jgi:hypothetical protein
MTPQRARHLEQEIRLLALELGTSGELRSVRRSPSSALCAPFELTIDCRLVGDIHFQAPRRFWTQTIFAPSYAYLFTDPQLSANPALGVFHSAELPYLFGNVSTVAPPKVANLSRAMLDYWISFAVSLTPNDGKGTSSAL